MPGKSPRKASVKVSKASAKAPDKRSPGNGPKILTGAMMAFLGILLSLTGIGAIVGVPLFLTGFVILGFFLFKEKRDSLEASRK